ncbi:hypothetical protein [Caldalkalibacillus mannanilyticus]|uniref:hypothetical protein n=1 Tax=Caldalkalibacillus mannanilyticus TaxID=1418 RepID=UPI0011DD8267|nr:hypothetical protein [Caldalkalibacillus mannanilyticus]
MREENERHITLYLRCGRSALGLEEISRESCSTHSIHQPSRLACKAHGRRRYGTLYERPTQRQDLYVIHSQRPVA